MDSSLTSGVLVPTRASHDCHRQSFSAPEKVRAIDQALGCYLPITKDEGGSAKYVTRGGRVATDGSALAAGRPNLPTARVIKQVARVNELISWTDPLGAEIQIRLLIVVLEKR